jgi:hypothetical protein
VKTNKATLRVAFFVLGLLSFSCRQDASPVESLSIDFHPVFTPGDEFLYDAILTDRYGYSIPSSRSKARWKVLSTGWTEPGLGIGTVFLDSASVLREGSSVYDTVTVAVAPNGDLYRFGFLATIARIRKLPPIPDSWDRIATFSQGSGHGYFVGYMDSAKTAPVYSTITGATDMFAVQVKGQQMVFPAHRVDIVGDHIQHTFWVSDGPASFLLFWLEPDDGYGGVQLTLTEIRAGS